MEAAARSWRSRLASIQRPRDMSQHSSCLSLQQWDNRSPQSRGDQSLQFHCADHSRLRGRPTALPNALPCLPPHVPRCRRLHQSHYMPTSRYPNLRDASLRSATIPRESSQMVHHRHHHRSSNRHCPPQIPSRRQEILQNDAMHSLRRCSSRWCSTEAVQRKPTSRSNHDSSLRHDRSILHCAMHVLASERRFRLRRSPSSRCLDQTDRR